MRSTLAASLAITAAVMVLLTPAHPARAGVEMLTSDLGAASPVVVLEKRKSCWRTNRSTGKKFRIC